MRELTTDNALAYLTEKGWIVPGPARIDLLGGGVSNVVLRVETPWQTFILKQSRPQLRTRDDPRARGRRLADEARRPVAAPDLRRA